MIVQCEGDDPIGRTKATKYGRAVFGRQTAVIALAVCFTGSAWAGTDTSTTAGPAPAERTPLFRLDPVVTTAVLSGALGFGILSELILSTGEIRPQDPADPSVLLSIDRGVALSDHVESGADSLSDLGLALSVSYAVADSLLSGVRGASDGWLTYVAIYAETFAFNWAIGNTAKVAVRRPRPTAYFEKRQTGVSSVDTNSGLSFYSLHAAVVAGFGATATYMAFARDDSEWEKWLTLAASIGLTTFVGWTRVGARAHFPTDVIAGALAGASIGVLVPHLQRNPESFALSFFGDGVDSAGLVVLGAFD